MIKRDKVLVELVPEESMLQVTLRTELRGEQMSNFSWLIFAAIDALVKEWYNLEVYSQLNTGIESEYSDVLLYQCSGQGVCPLLALHEYQFASYSFHVPLGKVPGGRHLAKPNDTPLSQQYGGNFLALLYVHTSSTVGAGLVGGGRPKPVRLDHIAPDLAMVHLDQHKLEWSDLEKEEEPVAEGARLLFHCFFRLF